MSAQSRFYRGLTIGLVVGFVWALVSLAVCAVVFDLRFMVVP